MRHLFSCLTLTMLAATAAAEPDKGPTPQALIERNAREKSPVWADGDDVTFSSAATPSR